MSNPLRFTLPRMKYKKYLVLVPFFSLIPIAPNFAYGADCSQSACIDVYTRNGEIIIEGHKGSGPTKKKVITKVPNSPKPTVKKKPVPPKPSGTPVPKVKRTNKPRIVKKVIQAPAVSLSDRLVKLLPTAGVAYQPEIEPLINVPVYFWCDLPAIFQSRVNVIGEIVDVALRPSFTWSFGDGTFMSSIENGAPYPDGKIRHTYSQPGTYLVTLLSTWNGNFTHNGVSRAITGTVKKTSVATVTVVSAPTTFVN
jgi:hypothetical protein